MAAAFTTVIARTRMAKASTSMSKRAPKADANRWRRAAQPSAPSSSRAAPAMAASRRSTVIRSPVNSTRPVNAGRGPTAPPRIGTGIAATASPSERAKTERASRISASEEGGGEGIRVDIVAGSVYLAIVPCRDSMDKRPSIRPFRDRAYSVPARGAPTHDPPWWSAVLAARAAFAENPGAHSISVPLGDDSLCVDARGGWCAPAEVPAEIAAQLDLYVPYCLPHPGGLCVAHI